MQENHNRITPHAFIDRPARIRVLGYKYQVDYGPTYRPRIHLVDRHWRRSCELGADCPVVDAVAEYLRRGGTRAPDPPPSCQICGAETYRDRKWDGKYTKELGWRCTAGGLSHFLQAKAEQIRAANRRKEIVVSQHESEADR